jgi:short-subunit dehydrogenase
MSSVAAAGPVIIVTGSSRGIGREIARSLLQQSYCVVINGRDSDQLAQTADTLREQTGAPADHLLFVPADITTTTGAERVVHETLRVFQRIDGLINNAGTSMRGPVQDLHQETVETMMRGNLQSAVMPTVVALPALIETGGSVIFVSTVGALWGFPGISLYSASKAAVETFAQALDGEYRHAGVHAGVCYLGFVENDPEKKILHANGTPFQHQRTASMTQQQAAREIITALQRRQRRRITTMAGRTLALLTRLTPRLVGYILARSGGSIHRVSRRGEQSR